MIFAALIVVLPLSPARIIPADVMQQLDWLGVLIFLALFAAAIEAIRRRGPIVWIVLAMTLLGLIYAPFNSGSAVLFVYACAIVPWATAGDARRTVIIVAGILGALSIEVWLARLSAGFWLAAVGWGAVAATGYLCAVNMMLSMDRLAKLAERERIARDLHDVLGHTLSLITLKAELAGQLLSEDLDVDRARKEIEDIESTSRSALAEVRQTISRYRIESLELEIERAAVMLRTAGVEVRWSQDGVRLDPASESAIGLALREAVTNVVRHAHARACQIRLQKVERGCLLEVQDDGLGGTHSEGQGLRGMRERIEGLGGSLVLDGSRGTRLTVCVPMLIPT
jgi:two-component system sensor histidine kinase DesK